MFSGHSEHWIGTYLFIFVLCFSSYYLSHPALWDFSPLRLELLLEKVIWSLVCEENLISEITCSLSQSSGDLYLAFETTDFCTSFEA